MRRSRVRTKILFAQYLEHLARRNLSPRTVSSYAECLRTFSRWLKGGSRPALCKATGRDMASFQVWLSRQKTRTGRPFSMAYQSKHIAAVRGLYRFLLAEGAVPSSPAADLKYPKVADRLMRNILSRHEVQRMLDFSKRGSRKLRDGAALRILTMSGLRASEMVNLNLDDVDMRSREVLVRKGKGAKDRLTFFDRRTQAYLRRYLRRGRPVLAVPGEKAFLVDDSGRRLTTRKLRLIVKRRCRKLGKTITPHCLRHTFCTLLLSAGANLKVIADLAGHASLDTTAKYARVNIDELAAAYCLAHPRSRT